MREPLMPDTSYLVGETCYIGGSAFAPIPKTRISGGAGVGIAQTSDGYFGIITSKGISPGHHLSKEAHGGYSKTVPLTKKINLIEWTVDMLV